VPNIGPMEIVLLLVLALFLFGAKRLPEIGRSLGSSMREFKDAVTGRDHPPAELPPAETASRASVVAREHDAL
jgi:sec-independent protein translocase protein TatA